MSEEISIMEMEQQPLAVKFDILQLSHNKGFWYDSKGHVPIRERDRP